MYRRILVFICKVLIKLLRLAGKNGSALPGLIMEGLYPNFLTKSLSGVQDKVILVTGTNGKTTSTMMLAAALRGTGARVVTNSTGSNMTRGLIAALIEDMTYFGSLKLTNWFVFEMDEAYAPKFTSGVSPKIVLALNVLRDQLDRYGEIDKTARLLEKAASKAQIYVYNQLDPLLNDSAKNLAAAGVKVTSFGVSSDLSWHVENEQSLHGEKVFINSQKSEATLLKVEEIGDIQKIVVGLSRENLKNADLKVNQLEKRLVLDKVQSSDKILDSRQSLGSEAPRPEEREDNAETRHEFMVPVKGFHNAMNATAVAATLNLLKSDKLSDGLNAISKMPTPFGRGEKLHLKGKNITVALVKNPSGFMSNLETFVKQGTPELILFAVNDRLADGRDVSWLWDVNFKPFINHETNLIASGIRGYDMALRLKHDGLVVTTTTSVAEAIHNIMRSDFTDITIIPTYTALFEVREQLSRFGKVPRIW